MSAINTTHPGIRIKTEVIPPGMSVTKAAKLMGVGRPALSNLLNGKAALSVDMATRLEKTFNCPRKDLLKMQADYEAVLADKKSVPSGIKAYVPLFLAIKADHIEQWSENISARIRLPVFLRTLIYSTGDALTRVDIPGNNDGERRGWDGVIEAGEGTPWVPMGRSGWEFSVTKDTKRKADDDFAKDVKLLQPIERGDTTFVFVTARRWPRKAKWIADARAKGVWKDVRAYDASDLEQWLEQSIPAQAWFANETNIPAHGIRSLDKCWEDWANVSTPPLPSTLFYSAIEAFKQKLLSRLSESPDRPILISADSTGEALAFLSQIFGELGGKELAAYRDHVLVFDESGILPRLAQGAQTFIPVVFTREVERELQHAKSMHAIAVYPRGVVTITPDIILEPANDTIFDNALKEMGKGRDEILRLINESGRSLTVLRRRLATIPAVQTPEWAADHKKAESLVPFVFVGAWDSTNETDKHALSYLARDREYADLEREFQHLSQLNDVPVWSIGIYRGVVSKLDLLYAIATTITPNDLNRYFEVAHRVLGEDAPALDLEDDKRWLAPIYGKTRKFSATFHKGISETLILLAVHSPLFEGPDTKTKVCLAVRTLLQTPLTPRILETNKSDLCTYAEAAPDEFLSILERDLKTNEPAVLGLMRPAGNSILGRPSRVELIWALELLAWNPTTFSRAVLILARLAQVEIHDNYCNKPIYSLKSIFRAWMPQTATEQKERLCLLKELANRFPGIAWEICVTQFSHYVDSFGVYTCKPRWSSDGYGFGEPLADPGLIYDFRREMIEMALHWKEHSLSTLSDLVERLPDLEDKYRTRIWEVIGTWGRDNASDSDKAAIREKIRTMVMTSRLRTNGENASLANAAKVVYAALEPDDLLNKYAWLFRHAGVAGGDDEIEGIEKLDFQKHEERIGKMRVDAMRKIRDQRGIAGILELTRCGEASFQIGLHAANDLLSEEELGDFLELAFQMMLKEKNNDSVKKLIVGALRTISDDGKRERVLREISRGVSEENMARLLLLAPFNRSTWKLIDTFSEMVQNNYWNDVAVGPAYYSPDEEINEAITRLLEAGRPRAAFSHIGFHEEKLDAQIIFRVLSEMAKGGNDRPGEYLLDSYHVERAFKHLNCSPMLTLDQKVGLEFAFIDLLAQTWDKRYGIPNLERYLEIHPEMFVQAVSLVYPREDGDEDPVEFQVAPDSRESLAKRAYYLLESIKRIPGHNDLGKLNADILTRWVATVRQSCAGLSRGKLADICIGGLLACGPVGQDGVWPCESIRQVMEEVQSEPMMSGAQSAVFNSRGVHMRGWDEGGTQERELADKYRKWSQALRASHPFVASKLLTPLEKTYEREASREDEEVGIRRRLLF